MEIKNWLLKHFWHETWYHRGCRYLGSFLKKHFIPHLENDHLPQALRPRALKFYAIVLILVKIFVTSFLFVVYPSQFVFSAKISEEVIELVNQTRLVSGLGELQFNQLLTQAAQAKVNDMMAKGYFSHRSPAGDKPWVWLEAVQYPYQAAGENLAMDFSSAQAVHQAFMNSPTHRKNILNPKYQEIGVAVAYGEMSGKQTAVLVQYFGSTQKYSLAKLTTVETEHQASQYEEEITKATQVAGEEKVVENVDEPYAVSETQGQLPDGQLISETRELNAPVVVAVPETNQARGIVNRLF